MLKNFLENMVVKEFNKQFLTQQAFSCSKLGKQTFMLATLANHDKYTDYFFFVDWTTKKQ